MRAEIVTLKMKWEKEKKGRDGKDRRRSEAADAEPSASRAVKAVRQKSDWQLRRSRWRAEECPWQEGQEKRELEREEGKLRLKKVKST